MKRLAHLLFLAVTLARADTDFNGTTNIGLASASSVTWGTNIVSASCWVYVRQTNGNYQYILDSSTALGSGTATNPRWVLGIGLRDTTKYVLEILGRGSAYRSQYILTAPNLDLNKWYHLGVVADCSTAAGNFKLYLNGTNQTLTLSSTLTSMGIGGYPTTAWQANTFCVASENTNAYPANATISEVALWNVELNANQFFSLSKGIQPHQIGTKPIAYWPLHITANESPGDLIGGNTLSKFVTITKTNNSPPIFRP